uniref:Macaca fascicularis brain cDNA clone: QtrA-15796, similar to human g20 protein (LOC51161), mRNA, RefSeq: NM_016210.2 n=1 Tax=Macaca fascicularis TaxID=9541 RepID=I7GEL9_MACFA|nr:unnamed protein product [Macaca fascicularis]
MWLWAWEESSGGYVLKSSLSSPVLGSHRFCTSGRRRGWRSYATSSCPCTTSTPWRNKMSWSRSCWNMGGTPPLCRLPLLCRPCRARLLCPPRAHCRGPAGWCLPMWPMPSMREWPGTSLNF